MSQAARFDDEAAVSPYRRVYELSPEKLEATKPSSRVRREVDLRDVWRVLVKHRATIFGVLLGTVVTTAFVVLTLPPYYTATATVQIERQAPKIAPIADLDEAEPLAVDKYDYYQTQYNVLHSRTVAARVIRGLRLDRDGRFISQEPTFLSSLKERFHDWFQSAAAIERLRSPMGVDPELIDDYLDMLSVTPVRNSRLVDVSFTSRFPDLSVEVAARHVEEYVNANLEQRVGMTAKAKELLDTELAKAKDRVVAAEVTLNDFRKAKGVVSLDGGISDIVTTRLGDLNQRFTEAQSERIRLEADYSLVAAGTYGSLPPVVKSSLIRELKRELSSLEAQRAKLSEKFFPEYPELTQVTAAETEVRNRLNTEIAGIVDSVKGRFVSARRREVELAKELETQRQKALDQKDIRADYATLKRDVSTARSLYTNLLTRLKDVDVAGEIKVSNITLVDEPSTPLHPSWPRKFLSIAIACLLGLVFGVTGAFVLEYLDDTLKTPDDVERLTALPTLGVVPSFDCSVDGDDAAENGRSRIREAGTVTMAGREAGASNELMLLDRPRSPAAEAYRTIRTAILLSSAVAPPQLVVFTSGSPGEGKTTSSLNEALTLAQSGARVLLVDADMRKPRFHDIFQLANVEGLSTYLSGHSTLDGAVHRVSVEKVPHIANGNGHVRVDVKGDLFVLPAGPMPPDPPELLNSPRMRETLQALRDQYDYVIIDTPPVLPVVDAAILGALSDGVVLIVRADYTASDVLVKSRDRLAFARAKIIGVVINDVDFTSGNYGRYERYYYSHYAPEA